MNIHSQKAIQKAKISIFASWNKYLTPLYGLLIIISLLPFTINNWSTLQLKFWTISLLLLITFKLNWKKLFFHKMSKKWLYVPHELVSNLPYVIFTLIAYGMLQNHDLLIYYVASGLFGLYILLNIPLYLRLKVKNKQKSIWKRNFYALMTAFFMVSPLFITTGFNYLASVYGFSFWHTWASTPIYLVLTFFMIYTAHIKYYFLTKKIIDVFVPNHSKQQKVLLSL